MRKYPLHVLIISFVFFLTPTIQAASDVERKIEELKQTIRINPDDVDAHANLGAAYADSGMYKEAIEACKQAIRIDPDYINAHYVLPISNQACIKRQLRHTGKR
jgi:tetratricopeptide (TPR) repeat protein